MAQTECPSCSPTFKLTTPRLHSGNARDIPETNKTTKLPPIPEVVWQQPTETITKQNDVNNIIKDSTSKADVASQTTPPKGNQPQKYVDTTEQSSRIQTGNEPVSFPVAPKTLLRTSKIQNSTQRLPLTKR